MTKKTSVVAAITARRRRRRPVGMGRRRGHECSDFRGYVVSPAKQHVFGLGQRLARREQKRRVLRLGPPAGGGLGHAGPDQEELLVLGQQPLQPRPVFQQGFVGQSDDGRAVVAPIRHQQPRGHQGIDQGLASGRSGQARQGHADAGHRVRFPRSNRHESADQRHEGRLGLGFQPAEDLFRTLADRSFQPTQLFVGLERQHALGRTAFIELVQGKLQERQGAGGRGQTASCNTASNRCPLAASTWNLSPAARAGCTIIWEISANCGGKTSY